MSIDSANPVVAILRELEPVLSEHSIKLRGVDPREPRRWKTGVKPSQGSAQKVALTLWDDFALGDPKAVAVRDQIFTKIVTVIPNAPCELWMKSDPQSARSAFGEWFFRLAETGGGGQTLTLETVEVRVAPLDVKHLHPDNFLPVAHDLLPVKSRQMLRIYIKSNRPAFLYVFWISPNGTVKFVFPGDDEAPEQERAFLALPSATKGDVKAWKFDNTPGLETLVVLAREKPMSLIERNKMRTQMRLEEKLPNVAKIEPEPYPFDLADFIRSRGIDCREVTFSNPVLPRHQAVASQFGGVYDAGRCLSFLHV